MVIFCIREKSLWDIAIEQSGQKEGKHASVINIQQKTISLVDSDVAYTTLHSREKQQKEHTQNKTRLRVGDEVHELPKFVFRLTSLELLTNHCDFFFKLLHY